MQEDQHAQKIFYGKGRMLRPVQWRCMLKQQQQFCIPCRGYSVSNDVRSLPTVGFCWLTTHAKPFPNTSFPNTSLSKIGPARFNAIMTMTSYFSRVGCCSTLRSRSWARRPPVPSKVTKITQHAPRILDQWRLYETAISSKP